MLDDDDPIAGFANLFDVAMVLAVALLVAMKLYLRVPAGKYCEGGCEHQGGSTRPTSTHALSC